MLYKLLPSVSASLSALNRLLVCPSRLPDRLHRVTFRALRFRLPVCLCARGLPACLSQCSYRSMPACLSASSLYARVSTCLFIRLSFCHSCLVSSGLRWPTEGFSQSNSIINFPLLLLLNKIQQQKFGGGGREAVLPPSDNRYVLGIK